MRYPQLKVQAASRSIVDAFMGYNHNLRISDGEFFDMKNLTSDHYPVLSPRKKRGFYVKPASPQGLIAKEDICYVDGTDFVMGETRINLGLSVASEDCPKQLVSMGAYVIIMPDKKYINTINPEDCGDIDASFTATGKVSFQLCSADGESYENVTVSPDAPKEPENLQYWIDTSSQPNTLKQYSSTSGMWIGIATTYVKIQHTGIGKNFNQHDGITISGITEDAVKALNTSAVVWAKGDDYIVITGILDTVATQTGGVTIERKMPAMDFVIESGNRLWGCRYGENNAGDIVNEIYASKLGDFKNWQCFQGLSTDSYRVSLGADGPFTGAVTYLGQPLFFRENCLHKIYGSYPAEFRLQTTPCRGVRRGCHKSLAMVDEVLYYCAGQEICAYDGALPEGVSKKLGRTAFQNAAAGSWGGKYYVSLEEKGERSLYVYDTGRKLWHREDDPGLTALCACSGKLYGATEKAIVVLAGQADSTPVRWSAQTGPLSPADPYKRYWSRILPRLLLEPGSRLRVSVRYDGRGGWQTLGCATGTGLRSFSLPMQTRRCESLELRLEGVGQCKLYSLTLICEEGAL